MRLINTTTGAFEEFIGDKKPGYAILSHTWGVDEMSYRDMSDPSCTSKEGRRKIEMTCRLAAQQEIKYAWVDTCCIDKSSSAELTEAINSMYQWYQRSKTCYVFLGDLSASQSTRALKGCRWFSRGWTLQELIAPSHLSFFDQDWNYRGSKADLAEQLSEITKIDAEVLLHQRSLPTIAVAQRMSWAAFRQTTRIEDMAYSLLGIFDVNMPLLYGEERKAFRRLQEEIIKSTSDLSLFAWELTSDQEAPRATHGRTACGILAQSPAAFASCQFITKDPDHAPAEFVTTNIGVKTQIQLARSTRESGTELIHRSVLPLRCSSGNRGPFGVQLRKCGFDQFVRDDPWNLIKFEPTLHMEAPRVTYLLADLPKMEIEPMPKFMPMSQFIPRMRSHVLDISFAPGFSISDAWNWGRFDYEDGLFIISGDTSWDSTAMRIQVMIPEEPIVECTFYAVRWSHLGRRSLQYTIVESRRHTNSLDDIQSRLMNQNYTSHMVMGQLRYFNIPRTSSVAIKRPTMQKTAFISCVASLEENASVCQNKFWKVSFSMELLDDWDVPEINLKKWKPF
jgi:hypothetical protein